MNESKNETNIHEPVTLNANTDEVTSLESGELVHQENENSNHAGGQCETLQNKNSSLSTENLNEIEKSSYITDVNNDETHILVNTEPVVSHLASDLRISDTDEVVEPENSNLVPNENASNTGTQCEDMECMDSSLAIENVDNVESEQVTRVQIDYGFESIPYQMTGSWHEYADMNNYTKGCKWFACILILFVSDYNDMYLSGKALYLHVS